MELDKHDLGRHVREALNHFYEPAYLYTSPLADLLLCDPTVDVATALRECLRDAIESLRPPPSIPYSAPEWTSYRILWDRCIRRRSWHDIGEDLALGRSSVYKYMQQAIDALSVVLWNQRPSRKANAEDAPPAESGDFNEILATDVAKLAQTWPRGPVPVKALLRDVAGLVAPLAEERQLAIAMDVAEDVRPLIGDVAVLRQILVDILVSALEATPRGALRLNVHGDDAEARFVVSGLDAALDEADLLRQMALGQQLLCSYGGKLWPDRTDQGLNIVFGLPAGTRALILVVDDDPDALLLYQRFLRGAGYALLVAHDGAEAKVRLAESVPSLIILDVLMPKEDGWMILQWLKTMPETAFIPVLIYSVLGHPSVARSLGAEAVLRKPVREEELLSAVDLALSSPRLP